MKKIELLQCHLCERKKEGLFCELSEKHCQEIDAHKTTNVYKPHQVIFYEGNQPYGLYCIQKGKVKIYRTDTEGHQRIVRLAGPGDVIGYRSLIANDLYSGTAETLSETIICFIDKKSFFHLLETHPTVSSQLMKLLAKDLGYAEKQMLDMAHKTIRQRFAELLLFLKSKYGKKNQSEAFELEIELSRQEMAELIGTTKESLIRLLSEFKEEKLLKVERRKITLLDLQKLTHEADLFD